MESELDTEKTLSQKKKYPQLKKAANKNGYETVTGLICDLYQNRHYSSREIAKKLNWNAVAVLKILHKNDINTNRRRDILKKISAPDSYSEIDELILKDYVDKSSYKELGYSYHSEALCDLYYNKSISLREIGEKLGFSHNRVHYQLKKMKGLVRKPQRLSDKIKTQVLIDFKHIEPSYKNIQQYCLEKEIYLSPKTIQRFLKTIQLEKIGE